jgi:1-acyl-sn-glycerol-3-phosphate acyltransferase
MIVSRKAAFNILRLYSTLWMCWNARVVSRGAEILQAPKGKEKRVYLVLNHSTTYDAVAIMHLSKEPFTILMDEGAFTVPIVGRILRRAGFIPLVKSDSKAGVQACVDAVNEGDPLFVSLHDGLMTIGQEGRPRTGGLRIAHMTGATIYPIFVKAEEDRIHRLSIKGADGSDNPFSTFRNSLYFIDFLPPFDLSSLPKDATYEDFFKVALSLDEKAEEIKKYYDNLASEHGDMMSSMPRRGGARFRICW